MASAIGFDWLCFSVRPAFSVLKAGELGLFGATGCTVRARFDLKSVRPGRESGSADVPFRACDLGIVFI